MGQETTTSYRPSWYDDQTRPSTPPQKWRKSDVGPPGSDSSPGGDESMSWGTQSSTKVNPTDGGSDDARFEKAETGKDGWQSPDSLQKESFEADDEYIRRTKSPRNGSAREALTLPGNVHLPRVVRVRHHFGDVLVVGSDCSIYMLDERSRGRWVRREDLEPRQAHRRSGSPAEVTTVVAMQGEAHEPYGVAVEFANTTTSDAAEYGSLVQLLQGQGHDFSASLVAPEASTGLVAADSDWICFRQLHGEYRPHLWQKMDGTVVELQPYGTGASRKLTGWFIGNAVLLVDFDCRSIAVYQMRQDETSSTLPTPIKAVTGRFLDTPPHEARLHFVTSGRWMLAVLQNAKIVTFEVCVSDGMLSLESRWTHVLFSDASREQYISAYEIAPDCSIVYLLQGNGSGHTSELKIVSRPKFTHSNVSTTDADSRLQEPPTASDMLRHADSIMFMTANRFLVGRQCSLLWFVANMAGDDIPSEALEGDIVAASDWMRLWREEWQTKHERYKTPGSFSDLIPKDTKVPEDWAVGEDLVDYQDEFVAVPLGHAWILRYGFGVEWPTRLLAVYQDDPFSSQLIIAVYYPEEVRYARLERYHELEQDPAVEPFESVVLGAWDELSLEACFQPSPFRKPPLGRSQPSYNRHAMFRELAAEYDRQRIYDVLSGSRACKGQAVLQGAWAEALSALARLGLIHPGASTPMLI